MMKLQTFCCGLSLKHGTIIVATTGSILSFVFLVLFAAYAEHPAELLSISDPAIVPDTQVLKVILIIVAVASGLFCVFSIFLIFGATTNRPTLLLPWLSFSPICWAFYEVGMVFAIGHHSNENLAIFITSHLIISVVCTAITAYQGLIVLSYYVHLKNLNF